jgi:hypothetical protein
VRNRAGAFRASAPAPAGHWLVTERRTNAAKQPMTALHERYVWRVNQAVASNRMDLVDELSQEYSEEALRLMLATA